MATKNRKIKSRKGGMFKGVKGLFSKKNPNNPYYNSSKKVANNVRRNELSDFKYDNPDLFSQNKSMTNTNVSPNKSIQQNSAPNTKKAKSSIFQNMTRKFKNYASNASNMISGRRSSEIYKKEHYYAFQTDDIKREPNKYRRYIGKDCIVAKGNKTIVGTLLEIDGKYYVKKLDGNEIPLFDTDIIYVPKTAAFSNTPNGMVNTGPLRQMIRNRNVYINKVSDYFDKFSISDDIPDGYCLVASHKKMLEGIIRKQENGYFFEVFGGTSGMILTPNHVIFQPSAKYNQVRQENATRIPMILDELKKIINDGTISTYFKEP